jgi:hypothetical protein
LTVANVIQVLLQGSAPSNLTVGLRLQALIEELVRSVGRVVPGALFALPKAFTA